ncbi:hypothetical protein [Bacillus mojavensis]
MVTFTEWYQHTYKEEWHGDYAYLYTFADEITRKYEEWCVEQNIDPKWDG